MRLRFWTLVVVSVVFVSELHPYQMVVEADRFASPAPVVIQGPITGISSERTIKIVGNEFVLNGNPLHIISGSIHYFRLPAQYWRDRLHKLKAAGFNAVATYVEWSYHEPEYRQYNFTGDRDLKRFVQIAAEEGLLVLLRPGPYICAERDLGGLPYWLLHKYPHIKLRTTDKDFISESKIWMEILFTQLQDQLYSNGGPIILVQVENEYGSYGSDMKYKEQVRDMIKEHVRDAALLYTTDGTFIKMIRGGMVPGTLTTIDFGTGSNISTVFNPLRSVMPVGPLMNSEFYPGWLTHWGEQLQQVSTDSVVETLKAMLDHKINVNMYVFFGGTNFEFTSGANYIPSYYQPDITSYDYDAPLNEAGDPTPKYYAIRNLMEKYNPDLKNITPPMPAPKKAYGKVTLTGKVNLLSPEGRTKLGVNYPDVLAGRLPTFESLGQRSGMVLYEATLNDTDGILEISRPRDRVYVYVDGEFQGIISRMHHEYSLSIKSKPNSILSLLVENQGRINYGPHLHDYKGIKSVVKYHGEVLDSKWTVIGYPLENVNVEIEANQPSTNNGSVLYEGEFSIPAEEELLDTFLDTRGWTKGYIWVNGYNLGRYWPVLGPQMTLYVPGVWLHPGKNTIQILELEQPSVDLSATFIDHPVLNGFGFLSPF